MSEGGRLVSWLADRSDWLSPMIVKEVRQVVRGREFNVSFGASLVAGLAVAFFGAADALTGSGTTGRWTFVALMSCLGILGIAVVPLSAFSAMRNERMDQTLELITLTALSPRRVILGKLLAQGVKLLTLFAGIAPFIAMSFLLGGIDFVTILVSLFVLFMWSLWSCAFCLFLSTLFKSRAMSGLVFGGIGIALFIVLVIGRSLFYAVRLGGPGFSVTMFSTSSGSELWWGLAMVTTFCLASMANLVLLAENRLTLPTENRVTALRLGFLAQFLLMVAWALSYINEPERVRSTVIEVLAACGGLHLALVSMFAVTEDLVIPRRVLRQMERATAWRWLSAIFLPGGGRGALYILVQMMVMLGAAWLLGGTSAHARWMLAYCGYICFFTGVPAIAVRFLSPERAAALHLRVAVLVLLPMAMILPDLLYYVLWRPDALSLKYSARHLINPVRTLANWPLVEMQIGLFVPVVIGMTGLIAYGALFFLGLLVSEQPAIDPRPAAAGESGSADVAY